MANSRAWPSGKRISLKCSSSNAKMISAHCNFFSNAIRTACTVPPKSQARFASSVHCWGDCKYRAESLSYKRTRIMNCGAAEVLPEPELILQILLLTDYSQIIHSH